MRKRYEPLPDDARVFRTAKVGGGHLPSGHILPKPEWLEPTRADQEEAKTSGRPAGISVWDDSLATHSASCWTRQADPTANLSFRAVVADVHAAGSAHDRSLAVVADHLAPPDDNRWKALSDGERAEIQNALDGHSLIEGIKRPPGIEDKVHRSFREALASKFEPFL